MENTRFTNTKSSNESFIPVSVDTNTLNKLLNEEFFKQNDDRYRVSNESFDFKVSIKDDQFLFESTKLNPSKLLTHTDNLKTYFDMYLDMHMNFNNLESNSGPTQHSLYSKKSDFKFFNELINQDLDISHFLQELFKVKFFNSFSEINLFLHEKGSASSTQIQIGKNQISESHYSVKEFTSLFNSIRKSKNKSFGQSSIKNTPFKVIGTFITLDFSLTYHNAILLFTKNDFLPQKDDDINYLKDIKKCLDFYLNLVLKISINKAHTKTICRFLNINEPVKNDYSVEGFESTLKLKNIDYVDVNHRERISLLGELLNTLRHELSNPLFGLKLTSELLCDDDDLTQDQKDFMIQINNNIIRSQSIIENFCGLYSNKLSNEETDLEKLINEVLLLSKSAIRKIKTQLIFESEDCKKIVINQTFLAQIIFNLVINSAQAIKETNTSSPEILINICKFDNNISIKVSDNGPGISKEDEPKIFTSFYTTKSEGTGLGLAISAQLAAQINGQLTYNQQQRGAQFELKIKI